MKRAFTLAEIMIVLAVIGILSAILIPIARNSMPDENIMKFKKANKTLMNVIRELVTSDKYYLDGDLGLKADGNPVESPTYFCETISDFLNTKKTNCQNSKDDGNQHVHIAIVNGVDNTQASKIYLDNLCKTYPKDEIITTDDITYYTISPYYTFYSEYESSGQRLFGSPGKWNDAAEYNENNEVISTTSNSPFDLIYKPYCIDIDGINQGEDPFGYGIRADGKILIGKRATEWLEKSEQNND